MQYALCPHTVSLAAVAAHIAGGAVKELAKGAIHVCLIKISEIHRRIQKGFRLRGDNMLDAVLQLYQLTKQLR